MFNGHEVSPPTMGANANSIESGADVVYMLAVERDEGFECGGEDLGRERDFGFGRCERIDATDGSFVERDRKALLDLAFPEEFEDLVGVRRKCEDGCSGSTVFLHNSLVVRHLDRIMLLDTVDEDLADPFQLVLPRQAKESGKSWILDILLEEERPGIQSRM